MRARHSAGPDLCTAAPVGWEFVRRFVTLFVIVTCIGLSWQFIRAWLPKFLKEFHGYSPGASGFTVQYTRKVFRGSKLRRNERYTVRYDAQNAIVEVGPKSKPRRTTPPKTKPTTKPTP